MFILIIAQLPFSSSKMNREFIVKKVCGGRKRLNRSRPVQREVQIAEQAVGSITSRCSGPEPALRGGTKTGLEGAAEIEPQQAAARRDPTGANS